MNILTIWAILKARRRKDDPGTTMVGDPTAQDEDEDDEDAFNAKPEANRRKRRKCDMGASKADACPNCGEDVGSGDNYCASCGHTL